MAEVLGIVSSVITVVEVAGKIAPQLIALRRLWDEVQNIPETLNDQLEQLEMLCPILDDMGDEFSKTREILKNDNVAQKSFEYCRRAASELEVLIVRLQQEIVLAKKSKRTIAKFRVTLKKNMIEEHQRKLDNTLRLLMLSQSTYQMALTRLQPELIVSKLSRAMEVARDGRDTSSHLGQDSNYSMGSAKSLERPFGKLTFQAIHQRLPWLPQSNFVQISRTSFRISANGESNDDSYQCQVSTHQARIQLPCWLLQKAWDFSMQKANGMWCMSLTTWNVRSIDSEIFHAARCGTVNKMMDLLRTGQASIYDCTELGWTLLDFAMYGRNKSTVMKLTEFLNPQDHFQDYSITSFLQPNIKHPIPIRLDTSTLRMMQSKGMFDRWGNRIMLWFIYDCIWSDPEHAKYLTEELQPDLDLASTRLHFEELSWFQINPKVLLQTLNHERITPANFRNILPKGLRSSFVYFAERYHIAMTDFVYWREPENGGPFRQDICSWRKLATWIFSGAQIAEISFSSDGKRKWCPQPGTSPLTWSVSALCNERLGWSRNREHKENLARRAARVWLEDLSHAGIDLEEYGKRETELYNDFKEVQVSQLERQRESFSWEYRRERKDYPYHFTYGPRPEDWKFFWNDSEKEAYAGEFWMLVEPRLMSIPGAWIDEDGNEEVREY